MYKLHTNNLTIGFKNNSLITNLDACFEVGQINLVMGKSGTGKTTLLKTIAGFQKSQCGRIFEDDDDNTFNPSGRIALAFQNPEVLFFNPTVGEEVAYALKQRKSSNEEIYTHSRDWLSKWGLEPDKFWNRHPMSLSGGEQRRVALAACTVFSPNIIMLDEPLAGLDKSGQEQMVHVIKELSLKSIVIVVTHDPEMFLSNSKNVLILKDGKGISFNSINCFLKASLNDNSLYLLPEWYKDALSSIKHSCCETMPLIDAMSVFNYIKGNN